MSHVEGTRFNNRMQKTPEAILAKKEGGLPFGELAKLFDRQATGALENKLLVGSILPHLDKLLSMDPEDAEGLCAVIVKQNPKAFPDTLEDVRERAAYVLAVAYKMDKDRKNLH